MVEKPKGERRSRGAYKERNAKRAKTDGDQKIAPVCEGAKRRDREEGQRKGL